MRNEKKMVKRRIASETLLLCGLHCVVVAAPF